MSQDPPMGTPPPPDDGGQPLPGGQPPQGGQPSPGGQPPPSQPSGGGPPPPGGTGAPALAGTAGLGQRILARILDWLIIFIPATILFVIIGIGTAFTGGFGLRGWLPGAILSLAYFGYFVYLESNQGATLGKKVLNLKVVTADGSNPTMEQSAKRNVWMLFGLVPVIGGLASLAAVIIIIVTISSDPNNRGYHDNFAETAVMTTA